MSKKDYIVFWRWFWITIFILAAVYLLITLTALNKTEEKKLSYKEMLLKLQENSPKILEIIKDSSKISKEKIKQSICNNIDKAYEPLYLHIDNFADFHYSLRGEYTELLSILSDKMAKMLEKKLFKPANFDKNLNSALNDIKEEMKTVLKEDFNRTQKRIKTILKLNDSETDFLFGEILNITKKDTLKRFTSSYPNLLKAAGTSGASATGAFLGAKLFSKTMGKKLAIKLAAKASIKIGAKASTAGGTAAAGAEAGALFGPFGAAVGGVVGAVVGWIATDKIVIEVDKILNEEDFKKEIKEMIDMQKLKTKEALYKFYFSNISKITKDKQKSIENLKKKPVKDIMGI